MRKVIGPGFMPWGTPEVNSRKSVGFPARSKIVCDLLNRYEWKQHVTSSLQFNSLVRLKKIEWSIESKAFRKLNSRRTVRSPLYIASRMFSVIFNKADWVLEPLQNPDWYAKIRPYVSRKDDSWLETSLSKISTECSKLDMGRALDGEAGFEILSNGTTIDFFQISG